VVKVVVVREVAVVKVDKVVNKKLKNDWVYYISCE
jgi:hypothetical protein